MSEMSASTRTERGRMAATDLVGRAVEDLPSSQDHEHTVAQSARQSCMSCVLSKMVVPRSRSSRSASASTIDVHRIEAGQRLVEHQQLAARRRAWRELDLLRHPFDSVSTFARSGVGSSKRSSHACAIAPPIGRERPFRPPEILERGEHGDPLVETALLGQVADAVAWRRAVVRFRASSMCPLSGRRMCRSMRSVVVLPEPFGPMKP